MSKKSKDYWEEWAEALLAAGAAGDSKASEMYRIAHWLSIGGDCTDTDMAAITDYVDWVESNNHD